MSSLSSISQSLTPDAPVELFVLDATPAGGIVRYFVQARETGGESVSFGGQVYEAIDIQFSGLQTSATGTLPSPHIQISNTNMLPQALVNTFGDLLGCIVHRLRTYARFLDGHSAPDGDAYYGPDSFRIERKVSENPVYIEWELSASIDQEGKQLPGRQVIRDTCLWRYRVWNPVTSSFDYSKAQCPYTGTQSYDVNDQPVDDASQDVPSRRLNCCKVRFGAANALPFGGFPGVARVVTS